MQTFVVDSGHYAVRTGLASAAEPHMRVRRPAFDYASAEAHELWEDALFEAPDSPDEDVLWLFDVGPKSSQVRPMAELLFEKHKFRRVFFLENAAASLFSVARISGVVVDCGESAARCSVVSEGYVLPSTRDFEPNLAGLKLDESVRSVLKNELSDTTFEDSRAMRESIGDVSLHKNADVEVYHLPDGTKTSSLEVNPIVENHFFPSDGSSRSLTTLAHAGVSGVKTVEDRRKVMRSTLLTGGLSKTPSLADRLEYEMDLTVPKSSSVRPVVDRLGDSWLGASIYASVPEIKQTMFVTRDEWRERGHFEAVLDKVPL